MFGNFFGIVIISASALLIAGLILRPAPDLPATMSLGIVEEVAQPAAVEDTPTVAESTSSSQDTSSSSATDSTPLAADTAEKDSTNQEVADETKAASEEITEKPAVKTDNTPASSKLSKQYLEIKKQAVEKSANAPARANKSDR